MYRRRTPKAQPVNPVGPTKQEQPKPKQESNEPVIKAAVSAPRGAGDRYEKYCPMVNVLRPIKYIEDEDAGHYYVSFKDMVNILLTKGYLNVNFERYM